MKTILIFVGFYLPSYRAGGALRTIANLVDLLGDEFNFKIITRDRDFGDTKPFENIKPNKWNYGHKCEIFYMSTTGSLVTDNSSLITIINNTDFDTYYLNSFFDFHFSIKIILLQFFGLIKKKKTILAPRGEFMRGALETRALKKRIFIFISKLLKLHKNVLWHASTESEAVEIKREMGELIKYKTAIDVPDFSLLNQEVKRRKKEKDVLKILFLSVIVPKKNLKFAIEVLNRVEGVFVFDIYGPIKDEKYWGECLDTISQKVKDRIRYKGEINNSEIHNIYPNYDLFFFPTLGENFGHVVWESLAFGCPVLTSDKTPWNNLEEFRKLDIKTKEEMSSNELSKPLNAGWNFPLNDSTQIKEKIEELIAFNGNAYSKYNKGCSNYIDSFNKEKTLRDNINLFE